MEYCTVSYNTRLDSLCTWIILWFHMINNPFNCEFNQDGSAWTAGHSDLSQYIEIDLGKQYNISVIGTQGRQHTLEFVQEFKLESGIDGHDYNIYRDRNGNIKVGYNN